MVQGGRHADHQVETVHALQTLPLAAQVGLVASRGDQGIAMRHPSAGKEHPQQLMPGSQQGLGNAQGIAGGSLLRGSGDQQGKAHLVDSFIGAAVQEASIPQTPFDKGAGLTRNRLHCLRRLLRSADATGVAQQHYPALTTGETGMAEASVLIGQSGEPEPMRCALAGRYANRHGLVAGATGTGKTITLQILAEGFSDLGVPVFLADIKGDVAGLSQAGDAANPKLPERALKTGMTDFRTQAYPVVFWDVFGRQGHPVRATISDLGPLLLARMLDLNDTQEGVLNLLFKYADDQGLLLLDLKDLRALLAMAADNPASLGSDYGAVSKATLGVIQRALLTLEQQGAEAFFGEPALQLEDFMQTTLDGRGVINVLAADQLFQQPRLYATFLLWLLSELFEDLPERGDADLPKLVFFFDEAHLLFNDAPKALLDKIEQVVRLIRSKGVGIYFITQNPLDLPETILGQLGNRVQHALRAFTPRDQKAVRAAADTFRAKPGLDVATAITELGVGEALVSTLGEGGVPTPVERAKVRPPRSRMGAITPEERQTVMSRSPFKARYDAALDRESAYEQLQARAGQQAQAAAEAERQGEARRLAEAQAKEAEKARLAAEKAQAAADRAAARRPAREPDSVWESAAKSAARAASSEVGRKIGRELLRGLLGSLSRR